MILKSKSVSVAQYWIHASFTSRTLAQGPGGFLETLSFINYKLYRYLTYIKSVP